MPKINPAPAPSLDDHPLMVDVNRKYDALIHTLLRGGWYDPAELSAVRRRRAELLESLSLASKNLPA
jgi:hypothetical protein